MSGTPRSGFTAIEIILAIVILAILSYQGLSILSMSTESTAQETADVVVEEQARKVLRQIAFAIMGSDRESLNPTVAAPFNSEDIRYRINLGVTEGEVVWSDPEMIAMEEELQRIFWSRNPDEANEMRVVWSSLVAPYLEGELPNGMDDNGNGLIDEKGLSFVVDRNAVTIRLTLDKQVDGRSVTKTVETTVTCRNLNSGP